MVVTSDGAVTLTFNGPLAAMFVTSVPPEVVSVTLQFPLRPPVPQLPFEMFQLSVALFVPSVTIACVGAKFVITGAANVVIATWKVPAAFRTGLPVLLTVSV